MLAVRLLALLALLAACSSSDGPCPPGYKSGPLDACVVDDAQVPCRCATESSFQCCRKDGSEGRVDGCVGAPKCNGDVLSCPAGSHVEVFQCPGWPPPN